MGKIISENGVLWLEEKDFAYGKWHRYLKYVGLDDKKEEKPKTKKTKKGGES